MYDGYEMWKKRKRVLCNTNFNDDKDEGEEEEAKEEEVRKEEVKREETDTDGRGRNAKDNGGFLLKEKQKRSKP